MSVRITAGDRELLRVPTLSDVKGWLSRPRAASPENPTTSLSNPDEWLWDALGANPTVSGVRVDERAAVRISAVYRSIELIAGAIGSLPWKVYRKQPGGARREASEHPAYPLLHGPPNEMMTAPTWRRLMVSSLLLHGNAYARIERDRAERPRAMYWLHPQAVEVDRVAGRRRYKVHLASGGPPEQHDQVDILHAMGLSLDGLRGMSVIQAAAADSVGLAISMQQFAGRLHSSAARPSGVVEADGELDPTRLKNLKAAFARLYSGDKNVGSTIFLDNGMKWKPMQISPEDAQTLASRQWQVIDISRIFGVPPFLLGETEKATSWGSGIEEMKIGFKEFTLAPLAALFEAEADMKLLGSGIYSEMNFDGFLKGDSKRQTENQSASIRGSIMTINEVRRLRNLPPVEGGDRLLVDQTLAPLDQLGAVQQEVSP